MKKCVSILLVILMLLSFGTSYAQAKEYIYTTEDSVFSYQGNWSAGQVGYNLAEGMYANAGADTYARWSLGLPAGKEYTFYVWKILSDTGCPDATVNMEIAGEKISCDFSNRLGMLGWTKIGTYKLADGRANVMIEGKTGKLMVSAIKVVEGAVDDETDSNSEESEIYLKVGEKKSYKNGLKTEIDVPAQIVKDKTYLPLRYTCESLNAKVNWNSETDEAVINYNGKELILKKNSDVFRVNGEEKKLENKTYIFGDRMMIPLRAVSEELGYTVLWDESGAIAVTNKAMSDEQKEELLNSCVTWFK